jgi:putative NADH-flavin reductase
MHPKQRPSEEIPLNGISGHEREVTMRVTVLGGTGYAGKHIAQIAADRGHEVVSYSRNGPQETIPGVSYVTESILDEASQWKAVSGSDVVISALSTRGGLGNRLSSLISKFAEISAAEGVRLGVVGSFSDLRLGADAPRIATGEMPADYAAEAATMLGILEDLLASAPQTLDWFYVSPAAEFGPLNPGEARGTYRLGGEIALFDEHGRSDISGSDFGSAVVSEIESPSVRRAQFTVAY